VTGSTITTGGTQAIVDTDTAVVSLPAGLTVTGVVGAVVVAHPAVLAGKAITDIHTEFTRGPSMTLVTEAAEASSSELALSVKTARVGAANIRFTVCAGVGWWANAAVRAAMVVANAVVLTRVGHTLVYEVRAIAACPTVSAVTVIREHTGAVTNTLPSVSARVDRHRAGIELCFACGPCEAVIALTVE
jgi:hypothetical protein